MGNIGRFGEHRYRIWGTSVPFFGGTSDVLGNIGTVFLGNIGTGEHRSGEHRTFWGTSVPGNIGTGEHRYRGNIGTFLWFFGEHWYRGTSVPGNIGTGEHRYGPQSSMVQWPSLTGRTAK